MVHGTASSRGCPIGAIIDERVLTDFVIPAGFAGPLSSLNPAAFHAGLAGHVWCRFTLTPAPLNDPHWSGAGSFSDGETEDYLLAIADVSGSRHFGRPHTWARA